MARRNKKDPSKKTSTRQRQFGYGRKMTSGEKEEGKQKSEKQHLLQQKLASIMRKSKKSTDFSNMKLTTIPKPILEAEHLEILQIQNNEIASIPSGISMLKSLKQINLNNNRITKIPGFLSGLRGIKSLILTNNQVREIEILSHDCSIEKLILRGNKVSEIPENIVYARNLKVLDLSKNNIKVLPSNIGELTNLEELRLQENEIEKIPDSIGKLLKLRVLDLSSNRIKNTPKSLENLTCIRKFNLNRNPIGSPPLEVQNHGVSAVINYYLSLGDETVIYESKLLIVGQGEVGKTCLMRRLVKGEVNMNEISTEGIDINTWYINTTKVRDFRINVWDFGGQEIYNATHQFFLTKRSLYILVWAARTDDDLTSFDYWLNVLKLLSDNAPVIILQNKIDERRKNIDEVSLKEKFPNIVGFHHASALKGIGMEELTSMIKREVPRLSHIGDKLPKAWLEIRSQLEKMPDNFINYSKYLEICNKLNLNNKQASFLSQYFHDLGIVLHFADNLILRDILFLKPDWATNAVYKVVDTKEVQENFGEFHYDELRTIWNDYPSDKFMHLLELMKKFEICFQLPGTNTFIVPQLLRVEKPRFDWDYSDNLQFEYHYDFMPAGIVTRLIVRTHDLKKDNLYWKNGIVLLRESTLAMIQSDQFNRKIRVRLKGPNKSELLSIIRREVDYIHKTLNNPSVKQMTPCKCQECIESDKPFLHDFSILKKAQSKGKRKITCLKSFEDLRIETLLGGIEYEPIKKEYAVNVFGDYYNDTMKIEKIVNKKRSNVVFSDRIKNLTYHKDTGVDRVSFEAFTAELMKLTASQQNELITLIKSEGTKNTDNRSPSMKDKVYEFLSSNGVSITQNLSASFIYDILKQVAL